MEGLTVLIITWAATLVYPSIAIGVVSCTISKSKVFGWLRVLMEGTWLGGLLKCPYCLAHWLAFAAAWLVPISWSEHWVLDWFVQSMVLVGLSTITVRLLLETYFGFDN